MKDEELRNRLQSLPKEIAPTRDVWPDIERLVDAEGTDNTVDTRTARVYFLRTLAVAASLVGVVSLLLFLQTRSGSLDAWTVRIVEGTASTTGVLRQGERLETDSTTRFVATTDIGEVLVERNTNVALAELSEDRQVLSLERGEIYARIVAPPRVFVVETPSVTAIDLGCEYRLAVDDAGDGLLNVVSGWVALEFDDRETFVPAGASARIYGATGPAAPVFDDASERFKDAAAVLYAGRGIGAGIDDIAALAALLDEARRYDSLTLWHVSLDATRAQRAEIYDALERTGAVPEGFEKRAFVDQDPAAMEWLRIHLEESAWFRPESFFDSTLDLPFSRDQITKKKKRIPAAPVR